MPLKLSDFEGIWRIERRIEDHLAKAQGVLSGEAAFTPDGPERLQYLETGILRMGAGPPIRAERRYVWLAEDGRLALCFADGRPFHSFDPAQPVPCARHDCAPDTYDVRYDFAQWPDWSATWAVTGPRKDYHMSTHYRRA